MALDGEQIVGVSSAMLMAEESCEFRALGGKRLCTRRGDFAISRIRQQLWEMQSLLADVLSLFINLAKKTNLYSSRHAPVLDRDKNFAIAHGGRGACYGPVDHSQTDAGILSQGALNRAQWVFAQLNLEKISKVRKSGQALNFRDWPKQFHFSVTKTPYYS